MDGWRGSVTFCRHVSSIITCNYSDLNWFNAMSNKLIRFYYTQFKLTWFYSGCTKLIRFYDSEFDLIQINLVYCTKFKLIWFHCILSFLTNAQVWDIYLQNIPDMRDNRQQRRIWLAAFHLMRSPMFACMSCNKGDQLSLYQASADAAVDRSLVVFGVTIRSSLQMIN